MPKDDLLNKLGNKNSSEGATKVEPSQSKNTNSTSSMSHNEPTSGTNRGTDLLKGSTSKSESAATDQTSTENNTDLASGKVETLGSASNSKTTEDSWTIESAMKEIKKLRDENKVTRIKYSEAVEKLKVDSDTRVTAKEQELQELVKAKEELEIIKAKEEDRKRDLSEKLAHRESLVSELKTRLEAEKKLTEEKMRTFQAELERYKADAEAQIEVHKQRLTTELAVIPEKFKDIAGYIVKGAGDPRDALVALHEAKLRGVFEDKTIVVSHSVPGASDGARATKDKLDAAAQAAKDKMTPSDKIREGLKQVRSGEGNSAFRIR